ncbi:MAG: hypothetical protein ACI85I_000357 [Arenicella sp.]|jgi:hypothetical protein
MNATISYHALLIKKYDSTNMEYGKFNQALTPP